jgi:hypothetical protein
MNDSGVLEAGYTGKSGGPRENEHALSTETVAG